jgi:hypothetical protein
MGSRIRPATVRTLERAPHTDQAASRERSNRGNRIQLPLDQHRPSEDQFATGRPPQSTGSVSEDAASGYLHTWNGYPTPTKQRRATVGIVSYCRLISIDPLGTSGRPGDALAASEVRAITRAGSRDGQPQQPRRPNNRCALARRIHPRTRRVARGYYLQDCVVISISAGTAPARIPPIAAARRDGSIGTVTTLRGRTLRPGDPDFEGFETDPGPDP